MVSQRIAFLQKNFDPRAVKVAIYALLLIGPSLSTLFEDEVPMISRKLRPRTTDLYFKQRIAKVEEHCLRKGLVASHIYMDSNSSPYLFFAFPAKNSGVGLWFDTHDENVFLTATAEPRPVLRENNLHGAEIHLRTSAKSLSLDQAVLGSMRFIRDVELGVKIPREVRNHTFALEGRKLVIHRPSLNEMAEYQIEVEPLNGTQITLNKKQVVFESATEVKFVVRGLSSERPLTPLNPARVFKRKYFTKMDPRKIDAFSFLLYAEKFAAGSPRYLTQFGRDALITLYVLMEAMNPEALEDLIAATVAGMHPTKGFVSHEQDEGDFVSYVRLKAGRKYKGVDAPMESYKMIDDDFIFPIVISEYMKRYPARVADFLDRKDPRGYSHRKLILNNFNHVIKVTKAFASKPVYKNLIHLKPGETVGQWRDSDAGLGGGVYPFDVNAALVPGALKAMSDVYGMKQLDIFDLKKSQSLAKAFEVWNTKAANLFEIHMPTRKLASYGSQYFKDLKIDADKLPPAPEQDLSFPGIALDSKGQPVPIMHSDDSLMMTFGYPSPEFLESVTQRIHHQFPYGLKTPVGILVANPVFAGRALQKKFDATKYHGRVSWAMQEDLLMFGFERQLALQKLPLAELHDIRQAMNDIKKVIQVKGHMGGNEVFSILYVNGRYLALPFAGDAKSNSNQLWSHLRIASPSLSDDANRL